MEGGHRRLGCRSRAPTGFLLQPQPPGFQPVVQLRSERVHRSPYIVDVAVNGHVLAAFPALNGADVPFQVRSDVFPGVQEVFRKDRG